ncbi:hypothetical protein BDQ17DRAFT_1345437 [Cyathus striatus]|nr:hypothetical protein BDQ17DRAFT_1345437 [Cyathus striatus]
MDADLTNLLSEDTPSSLSSIPQGQLHLGQVSRKENLIDGSPETCWTSQQGLPQFIQLGFSNRVVPKRISLTFQGGFVGTRCSLLVTLSNVNTGAKKEWQPFANIYPDDVNRAQVFDLNPIQAELVQNGIDTLRIMFEESSDFFGRITVYNLKLEGTILHK